MMNLPRATSLIVWATTLIACERLVPDSDEISRPQVARSVPAQAPGVWSDESGTAMVDIDRVTAGAVGLRESAGLDEPDTGTVDIDRAMSRAVVLRKSAWHGARAAVQFKNRWRQVRSRSSEVTGATAIQGSRVDLTGEELAVVRDALASCAPAEAAYWPIRGGGVIEVRGPSGVIGVFQMAVHGLHFDRKTPYEPGPLTSGHIEECWLMDDFDQSTQWYALTEVLERHWGKLKWPRRGDRSILRFGR